MTLLSQPVQQDPALKQMLHDGGTGELMPGPVDGISTGVRHLYVSRHKNLVPLHPGGHHAGLPAACPCSVWPPNQPPAMAITTFGYLFPLCLVSPNLLALAPNHFYHGAGS